MESLNGLCTKLNCPVRGTVTSPLELGRASRSDTLGVSTKGKANSSGPTSGLPESWQTGVGAFGYTPTGSLIHRTETAQGQPVAKLISSYPVYVERVSRSEKDHEVTNITFRYKLPMEPEWAYAHVPAKLMFGPSGIAEVMSRGIVVHDADLFRKFVRESLDKLNAETKAKTMYDQFGWKNGDTEFLFGNYLYTRHGKERAFGSPDITKRSRYLGPAPRGTFEAWRDAADKLFAPNFEVQALAFLASCAAPLMRLQSHLDGGSIFSLVSYEGGRGKSTAMAAASSVWGRNLGMELKLSDTSVSKGIVLSVMGNLPLIIDEFSQRDPEALKAWVEVFTGGRDRLRGSATGGLVDLGMEWQTILIGGSNSSVVDALRAAKNGEPMANRVIEFVVSMPPGVNAHKGTALQEQLDANAGFAGDILIPYLLQENVIKMLTEQLPVVREDISVKHNLGTAERYKARFLAAIQMIAPIVRKLELANFSADRMMEWTIANVLEAVAQAPSASNVNSFALARFLDENQTGMLVVPEPWSHGRVTPIDREPRGALIARSETVNGRILIQEKALRRWAQKEQLVWAEFIAELKHKGILINERRLATLGAGTKYATGQVACLEINSKHDSFAGVEEAIGRASNVVEMKR